MSYDTTMDNEEEKASNRSTIEINGKDSLRIMTLLMQRGYFHNDVTPVLSDNVHFNCIPVVNQSANQSVSYPKDEASLIETSNKSYVMIHILREKFTEELEKKGRLLVSDAAEMFGVSSEILQRRVVPFIVSSSDQTDRFITVTTTNGHIKEILLVAYFQEQTRQLFSTLRDKAEHGWMLVSDAAKTVYNLPIDSTLAQLEVFIGNSKKDSCAVTILFMDNGSKVLVTSKYLESIKQKLQTELGSCCDSPVDVKAMSKSNGWEVNWILRIIQEGLVVPGEFRGNMYIPSRYIEGKENLVATAFATNGYVTSHMCYSMFHISQSQMKEYSTRNTSEESYVIFRNSVVNKDMIIVPLLESVRATSDSKWWLDLQLHLPIELLEYETNDVQALIDTYILPAVPGVACVRSDGALFFSQSMIHHFTKKRLAALVNGFGIYRANEIYTSWQDSESVTEKFETNDSSSTAREKRNSRKSTKSATNQGIESILHENDTFPRQKLVEALTVDYPDLAELESSLDLLEETCRLAFHTDELDLIWNGAIQTELQRLRSDTKVSLSIGINMKGLNLYGFQSIEMAFEDPGCFATCCYMIQAKAKLLSYAVGSTDRVTAEMKLELNRDFFAGCCREFVYRVTQYALYRNNTDTDVCSYASGDENQTIFYSPIDICSSTNSTIHFAYKSNQLDVITTLKEDLPRSISASLARTWELCDNGCNRYESHSSSDDVPATVGSVEVFLDHLRENCLAYCGLPFANFDKKAEKKFLSSRRLQLIDQLDKAEIMSDVLDTTVMLLYQTVKNLIVSGPLLRGPILRMLLTERKLTEAMASELRSLALLDGEVDLIVVNRVKALITSKSKP